MEFMCCLNMIFYLKILKMGQGLFAWHYAARYDRFVY